jgi:hypothetical protein
MGLPGRLPRPRCEVPYRLKQHVVLRALRVEVEFLHPRSTFE